MIEILRVPTGPLRRATGADMPGTGPHPAWCDGVSCDEDACYSPLEREPHSDDHMTRLVQWHGRVDPDDSPGFYIEVNGSPADVESARWLRDHINRFLALAGATEERRAS